MSPPALAVTIVGSALSGLSLLFITAGFLELAVILGRVGCIHTWVWHNLCTLLLWFPTLGIAAWQLAVGWKQAVAFVALGAIFITLHMLLLLAYWVRQSLRKQAAMELPTQQLLTEAHRMMMTGAVEGVPPIMVPAQPAVHPLASSSADIASQFRLQVGRSDGAAGLTLFIPGEAEEAALQAAQLRYQQQRMIAQAQAYHPPSAALPSPPNGERSSKNIPSRISSGGGILSRQTSNSGNNRESVNGMKDSISSSTALLSNGPGSPLQAIIPRPSKRTASSPAEEFLKPASSTPPRNVVKVVPEMLPRWGAGASNRSGRYRNMDNMISPSSSFKDFASTVSEPPPPSVASSSSYNNNANHNMSHLAGNTSYEMKSIGGGSGSMLQHEASLQHMLPRTAISDSAKQPQTVKPQLPVIATMSVGSVASPAIPGSPVSQRLSYASYTEHGVDNVFSILSADTTSPRGLLTVKAPLDLDDEHGEETSTSHLGLFDASQETNTSHQQLQSNGIPTQQQPTSPLQAPPNSQASGPLSKISTEAGIERRSGGSGGAGMSKLRTSSNSHRRSHSRTHSLPMAPSLKMALLDPEDRSAEASNTPSPTGEQSPM